MYKDFIQQIDCSLHYRTKCVDPCAWKCEKLKYLFHKRLKSHQKYTNIYQTNTIDSSVLYDQHYETAKLCTKRLADLLYVMIACRPRSSARAAPAARDARGAAAVCHHERPFLFSCGDERVETRAEQ